MNPEEEAFEKFEYFINSQLIQEAIKKFTVDSKRWLDVDDSNKRINIKDIDEAITSLDVEEFINAIKQSGVWSVRGFKQDDLDAILMLNLDPLIMKLFLTFALGELGQERVLNYLNDDENPDNVWGSFQGSYIIKFS